MYKVSTYNLSEDLRHAQVLLGSRDLGTLNSEQLFKLLEQFRVLDAAENNIPSYEEARHFESAPVFSETMHVMTPEVLVFSKKVWDTLAPDQQAALRKAAKESVAYYVKLWDAKEKDARAAVLKGGAKVIPNSEIDKKSFVNAEKPVWDKFANTPELKALTQSIVNAK